MIDKFSRGFINSVYEFNDFTLNELICKLAQKMDEVITQCNDSFNYLDWLKGQGLSDEVIKKMIEWKEDGTLESLINDVLLQDINTKVDSFKTEVNEQLDAITLLVSGLKNENNFDNAPIINNYINLAIKKGISTIKLPSGTYNIYSSVIIPSTNVKLIIESDMRTALILNGDIEGIVVDGGYTEDDYNTRVMNCNFKNIYIDGKNNYNTTGIAFRGFGLCSLDYVKIIGCGKGLLLKNGSEFVANRTTTINCKIGVEIDQSRGSASDDMAVIEFYSCYLSGNETSLNVLGCRNVTFNGGVINADATKSNCNAMTINSVNNLVRGLTFNNVLFEGYNEVSAIQIGKTNIYGIKTIVFNECEFGLEQDFIYVYNCERLELNNVYYPQEYSNMIIIDKDINFDFELIMNNKWSINNKIKVNGNIFMSLFNDNYNSLNNNNDFTYEDAFYNPSSVSFSMDTANYVTGSKSYKVESTTSARYLDTFFWNNGKQFYVDDIVNVDTIIKVNSGTLLPQETIFMLICNRDGSDVQMVLPITNTRHIVQEFSNGFKRVMFNYKAPKGKVVMGMRISNSSDITTSFNIDYVRVSCKNNYTIDNYFNRTGLPTANKTFSGLRIHISSSTVGDLYYKCIKRGNSYIWELEPAIFYKNSISVAKSSPSKTIAFNDIGTTSYIVNITLGWNTKYWISEKTSNGFKVNFETIPTQNSTIDVVAIL